MIVKLNGFHSSADARGWAVEGGASTNNKTLIPPPRRPPPHLSPPHLHYKGHNVTALHISLILLLLLLLHLLGNYKETRTGGVQYFSFAMFPFLSIYISQETQQEEEEEDKGRTIAALSQWAGWLSSSAAPASSTWS